MRIFILITLLFTRLKYIVHHCMAVSYTLTSQGAGMPHVNLLCKRNVLAFSIFLLGIFANIPLFGSDYAAGALRSDPLR